MHRWNVQQPQRPSSTLSEYTPSFLADQTEDTPDDYVPPILAQKVIS